MLTPEQIANMPHTRIACVANLFSRMMYFKKAGNIEYGHCHKFDHLTLLAHGSLKVTIDDKETVFKAPHMIYIKKDKQHQLEALEDETVAYCIHALRNGDGVDDIIDPESIPEGAHDQGRVGDAVVYTDERRLQSYWDAQKTNPGCPA